MAWGLLYTLDVLAVLLFAISYYRNCYSRGYRIDIWHAEIFLACVLPNLLMLPFARNEFNRIVLGRDYETSMAALPSVFLVTLLGYFAMLAGGSLWRVRTGLGLRDAAAHFLNIVPRCSMMVMSSRSILVFQTYVCFLLQIAILFQYFSRSGFGFDLRAFTFANPTLRPVAQTVSYYSVFIASHCLARYVDKRERTLLACTFLLTLGLVFFGSRGSIASIYMNVLFCALVRLRDRVNLLKLFALATAILCFAFYLGNVRAGVYSLSEFFGAFVFLMFYGNSFSDLRDFAWVYSHWDHRLWAGKTYIAAITAFVPRFASEFRDTWGLGVATGTTIGVDPHSHPGVRPGNFGEGFFNFGLLGVVAVGMLLGILFRRVDIDVKHAFAPSRHHMMEAFAATMLLGVASCVAISANLSGIYVQVGAYLFSWLCSEVLRLGLPGRPLNEESAN